jgi:uncharacterized protein YpuA (DUF1002 family)
LSTRTEHITMLSALTYVTALLAAGSTDASVIVAAPADSPVTGEAAMVGMLTAAGRCVQSVGEASSRVRLGYVVLEETARVATASGDWASSATIVAHTVQAVVTGQARDESAIVSALEMAAAESGVALDEPNRAEVGSKLSALLG